MPISEELHPAFHKYKSCSIICFLFSSVVPPIWAAAFATVNSIFARWIIVDKSSRSRAAVSCAIEMAHHQMSGEGKVPRRCELGVFIRISRIGDPPERGSASWSDLLPRRAPAPCERRCAKLKYRRSNSPKNGGGLASEFCCNGLIPGARCRCRERRQCPNSLFWARDELQCSKHRGCHHSLPRLLLLPS